MAKVQSTLKFKLVYFCTSFTNFYLFSKVLLDNYEMLLLCFCKAMFFIWSISLMRLSAGASIRALFIYGRILFIFIVSSIFFSNSILIYYIVSTSVLSTMITCFGSTSERLWCSVESPSSFDFEGFIEEVSKLYYDLSSSRIYRFLLLIVVLPFLLNRDLLLS